MVNAWSHVINVKPSLNALVIRSYVKMGRVLVHLMPVHSLCVLLTGRFSVGISPAERFQKTAQILNAVQPDCISVVLLESVCMIDQLVPAVTVNKENDV